MEQFHGTNNQTALSISMGNIDVTSGGGEFGRGFYTGDLAYEAFAWAWHQYKSDKSVVKIIIDDDSFLNLEPYCLDLATAINWRRKIRNNNKTRSFLFNVNAVWGPVVGRNCYRFSQIKYESDESAVLLNSTEVTKLIL